MATMTLSVCVCVHALKEPRLKQSTPDERFLSLRVRFRLTVKFNCFVYNLEIKVNGRTRLKRPSSSGTNVRQGVNVLQLLIVTLSPDYLLSRFDTMHVCDGRTDG